jgi:hypothetical protein
MEGKAAGVRERRAIPERAGGAAWPLFAGLGPLGALPTVARLGRMFTVAVLDGWGLAEVAEDAELIVSELCGNVVGAATGEDGALLRIEAWDTVAAELGGPAPRRAASLDESGRGLQLVASLSLDWGWDRLPGRDAKRVWATLKGSR